MKTFSKTVQKKVSKTRKKGSKIKVPAKKTIRKIKKESETKKASKKFDTKRVPLAKKIKLLFRLKKGIEKRGPSKTIALVNIVVPKSIPLRATLEPTKIKVNKNLKSEIDAIILNLVTEQVGV